MPMPPNLSAHITAVVAFLSSILAAIHPGFTINPIVQEAVVPLGVAIAGLLEASHVNLKGKALQFAHEYSMQAAKIAAEAKTILASPVAKTIEATLPVTYTTGLATVVGDVTNVATTLVNDTQPAAEGSGEAARPL